MYKAAIIGDTDSVYGFAAAGMEICVAEYAEDAKRELQRLASANYAVIFVTEQLAALMPEEMRRYSKMLIPAVVPVPGVFANTGAGMRALDEAVIKAVGAEII